MQDLFEVCMGRGEKKGHGPKLCLLQQQTQKGSPSGTNTPGRFLSRAFDEIGAGNEGEGFYARGSRESPAARSPPAINRGHKAGAGSQVI